MSAKAQLSFDFLIACSIFILVVGILFTRWTYTVTEIDETRHVDDMVDKAYVASEIWFRDGVPRYWEPTDVAILGLQNDNRFNRTKMDSLYEIGYDGVRELAGVGVYGLYFRVFDGKNTTIFNFTDSSFPLNAKNIFRVKRAGILNQSIVFVEVLVWE